MQTVTGNKPALRAAILLCASLLLLAGCGAPTLQDSFLRPDLDLAFIERIAVPPFENHSTDKYAGARLRDITITHLLMRGDFTVVDKGIVDSAISEEAIKPGAPLGEDTIKRLGQALGVQALLLGTIDQLSEDRQGGAASPRLTCTLRLVDTAGGTILWQAAGSRSGATMSSKLFGTAVRDEFQVGRELIADLLATLPARPSQEQVKNEETATAD
ncbi:MAG TPA: hypothetical protein ENJ73_02745 [Desulfobacterales bacterium]|nr:hypothetical protein [Desulfobacterales bacterium]